MNRPAALIAAFTLLALFAGCQCCPTAECYYQTVDHFADCELELDCFYHPELDVSRIGKSDWCRCPINRLLCGCACRRQCCYVPAWGCPIEAPCPEFPRPPVPCIVPPCPPPVVPLAVFCTDSADVPEPSEDESQDEAPPAPQPWVSTPTESGF